MLKESVFTFSEKQYFFSVDLLENGLIWAVFPSGFELVGNDSGWFVVGKDITVDSFMEWAELFGDIEGSDKKIGFA